MQSLKEVVGRVLSVDPNSLVDESSPENISSWDSFNALLMVSELEKNFEVKFSMEEVMRVKNYGQIKEALRSHGVEHGLD